MNRKVRLSVWVRYDSKTGYVWPQVYESKEDAYLDENLNYPLKIMELVSRSYIVEGSRQYSGSFGTELLEE